MKIHVECLAGYRGEDEPSSFTLGATRFPVTEIVDRWMEPDHRYFKVKSPDGRLRVLRHDTGTDQWELAALVGEALPTPGHLH